MSVQMALTSGKAPVKIWTRDVEQTALQQLENMSALPFIHSHIAVMPDVHAGYGSTVGSVIPTKGAIIPAAVGVDIGCGMMAQKLHLRADQLPDNLRGIRKAIECAVPHGRTDNGGPNDRGAWGIIPSAIAQRFNERHRPKFLELLEKHPKLDWRGKLNSITHLGTLGTGNHFIELCLDENEDVWVMLHSGSRGVGNRIGTYFTELAKEDMRKWHVNLPDTDLAYMPEGTDHFDDYIEAMLWAQDFAESNRDMMMRRTLAAIHAALGAANDVDLIDHSEVAVNCHHNYAQKENHFNANVWVTRKGAVRARKGDLGIIPGSMGARSYIVEGLGNEESFCSCSHGAGRKMSRTKARNTFDTKDLIRQTDGVECRKDDGVLDEIPGAYKDIDEVMALQEDLVRVRHTLRQVVCVKG